MDTLVVRREREREREAEVHNIPAGAVTLQNGGIASGITPRNLPVPRQRDAAISHDGV